MSEDRHTLRGDGVTATVLAQGAELCSLKTEQGLELLWQAGPEWRRHAPLLFPIVGKLKNDQLCHRGKRYPMIQHGFARGGAPFLCVEPWRVCASPADFDREFADKPGIMHIASGEAKELKYRIGVR
jgi:galactose mutarotase-like enzyme